MAHRTFLVKTDLWKFKGEKTLKIKNFLHKSEFKSDSVNSENVFGNIKLFENYYSILEVI